MQNTVALPKNRNAHSIPRMEIRISKDALIAQIEATSGKTHTRGCFFGGMIVAKFYSAYGSFL